MRVENENPLVWPSFFKYFRQFRVKKKRRPSTFVAFALRFYNSYNHAHAPGPHIWPSLGPWLDSKCSKTVEVGCSCSKLKPCQGRSPMTKSKKKKNDRECSNIKSTRVSALTGSVPCKMAKGCMGRQRLSVMDGWSVTQHMIVYKDKLPKKSWNRKSKLVLSKLGTIWLSNIAFPLLQIGLQGCAKLGCNWFRIKLDIVSKLLHAAICCAFRFESEKMPFPGAARAGSI